MLIIFIPKTYSIGTIKTVKWLKVYKVSHNSTVGCLFMLATFIIEPKLFMSIEIKLLSNYRNNFIDFLVFWVKSIYILRCSQAMMFQDIAPNTDYSQIKVGLGQFLI